jgi:peptidoglycan/xylan/chitin deacetylase (PgdA/CDA1 family)
MLIATSWDDGLESDRRLLGILERYGVRASFALSPVRHGHQPRPNDARDVDWYGMLLPAQDLTIYREHDICNLTANRREQTGLGLQEMRLDIYNGKALLEGLFGREVPGIAWPGGSSNRQTLQAAREFGHRYARTLPADYRRWRYRCWDIVPWPWFTPLETLFAQRFRSVALSGHTYELRTEADWERVERFYREASQDPRCQLGTLSDLVAAL